MGNNYKIMKMFDTRENEVVDGIFSSQLPKSDQRRIIQMKVDTECKENALFKVVSEWLVENGAEDGEMILIKH